MFFAKYIRNIKPSFSPLFIIVAALAVISAVNYSHATVVQFQTVAGNFEVNLFDDAAPITVANFLSYVEQGQYDNSVIHRSVEDFVIQGGGYVIDSDDIFLDSISRGTPIDNEAYYSNVRGTIAMAKIANDPHSATSEWFINLSNNSEILDHQNGGFTVFGQVIEPGMDVVDAIAGHLTFRVNQLEGFPLVDYTEADAVDDVPIERENLLLVTGIVIIDATSNTAGNINIDVISELPQPTPTPEPESYGAGSINLFMLTGLFCLVAWRRKVH